MRNVNESKNDIAGKNFRSFLLNDEEGRKKISYELQNSVNHLLFTAKLNVYLIENKIVKNRNTSKIKKLLDNAIKEIIEISYSLYPVILDEIGLIGAINNLLKEFKRKTGIPVQFEHYNISKQLPLIIKTNLFRILQEILNQIKLKKNASKVFLSINQSESFIVLVFQISGKISEIKNIFKFGNKKSHAENLNIKERIDLLNGDIDLRPFKPAGWEITLKFPINDISN